VPLRRGSIAGLRSSICSSRTSRSSSAVEESMASEESRGCFCFGGGEAAMASKQA